jgi:hypothetical protein
MITVSSGSSPLSRARVRSISVEDRRDPGKRSK